MLRPFLSALATGALLLLAGATLAQSSDDAVHVTVTMNPDGSKTVYETNAGSRRCVATTTEATGRLRGKTIYRLDDQGRYESGAVFTPGGTLRFKSIYHYDSSGRLDQETQLGEDGNVLHKIVYSFDGEGRPSGYAIYDGMGNLLGRTTPKSLDANKRSGR